MINLLPIHCNVPDAPELGMLLEFAAVTWLPDAAGFATVIQDGNWSVMERSKTVTEELFVKVIE